MSISLPPYGVVGFPGCIDSSIDILLGSSNSLPDHTLSCRIDDIKRISLRRNKLSIYVLFSQNLLKFLRELCHKKYLYCIL